MIKIIHFADFHMGVDTYGPMDPHTRLNGRVLDYLDSFDAMIEYGIEHGVDLVVFAGDAFHRHSPTPTYLREFTKRIYRLSEICPIVLVVGNHDKPGSSDKASSIDIYDTIHVRNVTVGNTYDVHTICAEGKFIQVATVPYPYKNEEKPLSIIIDELSEKISPELPAILVGHFSVDIAMFGSELLMTVGDSAETSIRDLISDKWDYVALGHLHYHQELKVMGKGIGNHAPIVYAGSLERIDFGEEDQQKGFVWVEIYEGEVTWEFVEVDARTYKTIRVDARKSRSPTNKIISKIDTLDLEDAIVRVVVEVADGSSAKVRQEEIRRELKDAGVYYVHSIGVKEDFQTRSRLDLDINVASLDEEGLLDTYFDTIDYPDDGKRDELMNLAFDIMDEVDNE